MINNSRKNILSEEYSFDDKIKEVCKENPFKPASNAGSFYISNTDNGLHIFIGKKVNLISMRLLQVKME